MKGVFPFPGAPCGFRGLGLGLGAAVNPSLRERKVCRVPFSAWGIRIYLQCSAIALLCVHQGLGLRVSGLGSFRVFVRFKV